MYLYEIKCACVYNQDLSNRSGCVAAILRVANSSSCERRDQSLTGGVAVKAVRRVCDITSIALDPVTVTVVPKPFYSELVYTYVKTYTYTYKYSWKVTVLGWYKNETTEEAIVLVFVDTQKAPDKLYTVEFYKLDIKWTERMMSYQNSKFIEFVG